MTDDEYNKLMDARIAAGKLIDPATAIVWRQCVLDYDPYNDGLEIDPKYRGFSNHYFVRAPDSDVVVFEYDLPEATRKAIFWRE
jgi:hypothetical protein